MNGVLGQTGPGEPPEDGEMNEMTLPSIHRIRNSRPGLDHGGGWGYITVAGIIAQLHVLHSQGMFITAVSGPVTVYISSVNYL